MSSTAVLAQDTSRARSNSQHRRPLQVIGVLVLYATAAILLFQPLSPLSSDALSRGGIGDPAQMVWFLAYTPHALTHGLNPFWTNLIDYPTGVNLANNTSVPLLGLIAWPITATLGPVSSLNFLVRLGLFLNATSFFFALKRWAPSTFARFVGGLCFGFGPYAIGQVVSNTHINLLFVAVFPLLLPILDEMFVRQRRSWQATGAVLGLAASAEMLIAPELLSDFAIIVFIAFVWAAIRHRDQTWSRARYALQALGISIAIFAFVCGFPIWEMLFGSGHLHGAVYAISHLQSFRNSAGEVVIPSLQQFMTTTGISGSIRLPTRDLNELGGYLSIPMLCAVAVTIAFLRKRAGVTVFAVATAAAFILSLGGAFHFGRTSIALPERVFASLPLLNNTVPDRFSVFTLLGATSLFAIGVDRSYAAITGMKGRRRALVAGGLTLAVISVVAAMTPRVPIREQKLSWSPSISHEIAAHLGRNAVVLTYPYATPPLNQAMAWQAETGFAFSLLGAYATVPSPQGDGQEWPLLQHPSQVQSYLARLELGSRSRFPQISIPTAPTALCAYVNRYHVTDIVIFQQSPREPLAAAYLSGVAHTTTFTGHDLTILHLDRRSASASVACHGARG